MFQQFVEGLSHILSSQILTINMWYRYYKNNFIDEETDFHETKWFVKGDIINNDGTESQNYSLIGSPKLISAYQTWNITAIGDSGYFQMKKPYIHTYYILLQSHQEELI